MIEVYNNTYMTYYTIPYPSPPVWSQVDVNTWQAYAKDCMETWLLSLRCENSKTWKVCFHPKRTPLAREAFVRLSSHERLHCVSEKKKPFDILYNCITCLRTENMFTLSMEMQTAIKAELQSNHLKEARIWLSYGLSTYLGMDIPCAIWILEEESVLLEWICDLRTETVYIEICSDPVRCSQMCDLQVDQVDKTVSFRGRDQVLRLLIGIV